MSSQVGLYIRVDESTRELLRETIAGMKASRTPGEGSKDCVSMGALVERCVLAQLAPAPAAAQRKGKRK